jgi:hypothetical protein
MIRPHGVVQSASGPMRTDDRRHSNLPNGCSVPVLVVWFRVTKLGEFWPIVWLFSLVSVF